MATPRKRPVQQRSRRTVELVLEAAAQVLEAGGLARFNTNAVAERAGVSVGTIYQYFPDKDAVMAEIARRETARFEAALGEALQQAGDLSLAQAVEALVRVAVVHQMQRPQLARILDLEERRLGIDGEAETAARTTASRLAGFLEQRGIGDPETAALDLLNLTRGMIDGAAGTEPADLTRRIVCAATGYLASA